MDTNRTAAPTQIAGTDLRVESVAAPVRKGRRTIRERIVGGLLLSMPLLLTIWVITWIYSILEDKLIDPLAAVLLWKLK